MERYIGLDAEASSCLTPWWSTRAGWRPAPPGCQSFPQITHEQTSSDKDVLVVRVPDEEAGRFGDPEHPATEFEIGIAGEADDIEVGRANPGEMTSSPPCRTITPAVGKRARSVTRCRHSGWLPARWASRVEPASVLREE